MSYADKVGFGFDEITPEQFMIETERIEFKLEDIKKLTEILRTENSDMKVFFATHGFRKLLSLENNPPFRETIDNGLVSKFLELCKRFDFPKL